MLEAHTCERRCYGHGLGTAVAMSLPKGNEMPGISGGSATWPENPRKTLSFAKTPSGAK